MSADRHAHEELAHIARMIAELERVAASAHGAPSRYAVMHPEYWRRRIDALVLTSTDEPLRRDADALRKRLARVVDDAAERISGETGETARETGGRK
ncbi:hypothetical protein AWB78_01087 [Caballeronia calidae]|uniref:Uncharacterized protein n=1 Tax=Caballeronia calidae TaxID=1777139 RepID=A0A157ZZA8_9BURK|nr:hypothetical protein [Caballeronia calidae]SAK50884.1 hypothetical protein AWB78_01087 [Caballeronia calidae]